MTKRGRFLFQGHGHSARGMDKIKFDTFLKKKIKFLGFHAVVLVKTFPLMYQLLM